jgi:hypothetical protein
MAFIGEASYERILYIELFGMDERDVEQGYASFHRKLNHLLRQRDVKQFKAHIARHPGQAGKLSHCLGLSDEFAEVEMHKAILVRSALKDLHQEARDWLEQRNIEPPPINLTRRGQRRRKRFGGKRKTHHGRK